jgi:hypothetical protein
LGCAADATEVAIPPMMSATARAALCMGRDCSGDGGADK